MRFIYRASAAVVALLAATIILFIGFLGWTFYAGKNQVASEWAQKMPKTRRTPAEIRGLVDNLVKYRHYSVPAFVPESGWDNEFCAAAAANMINFILGEERLTTTAAWLFSKANDANLELVYDRSSDFTIAGQSIIEIKERGFSLTRLLKTVGEGDATTSDRIYIVGYHYRNTVSDPLVIKAHGTLNTHLMVILGKYDGSWWGYHMLHDPARPHDSPFRIDNLGEQMPELFDLMYIWEVKDSAMTAKGQGAPLVLVHNRPDYSDVIWRLGIFGPGARGYFADTVITKLFGAREQFPRVVDLSQDLAQVVSPLTSHLGRWGDVLGFYRGLPVMRHRGMSHDNGVYGKEYQCVELVNRFLVKIYGYPILRYSGEADSYFYGAKQKRRPLTPIANGAPEPPRPDDVLVFDPDGPGKVEGHVGIVYRVSETEVCIVQQNMPRWRECVPITFKNGLWVVDAITPRLPCVGWSRTEEPKNEERSKIVVDPNSTSSHRRRRR